ncbi:hypothetical protein [Halosimplex sp. J119]
MSDHGLAETFLRHACERRRSLAAALGFVVLMVPLMIVSLTYVEEGSSTYVITVVNLAGLAFFGLLFAGLLFVCRKRANDRAWR